MTFFNEIMQYKVTNLTGFFARIVQHEVDHLKGKHIANFQINQGTLENFDQDSNSNTNNLLEKR